LYLCHIQSMQELILHDALADMHSVNGICWPKSLLSQWRFYLWTDCASLGLGSPTFITNVWLDENPHAVWSCHQQWQFSINL
jgi:hypothetical protein